MVRFRFATDGFQTVMELDGKTIGAGVNKVEFLHESGEHAEVKLDIDLDAFCFLPDGEFDKRESVLMAVANQHIKEQELLDLLGEEKLRHIGEELAEIVRQHNLHKSPAICRALFSYFSDVINGWNCV